MKYDRVYSPTQKGSHVSYLKRIGAIARGFSSGWAPSGNKKGSKGTTNKTARAAARNRRLGARSKYARYVSDERRAKHKKAREEKQAKKAKLQACGHGSRWTKGDEGKCKHPSHK